MATVVIVLMFLCCTAKAVDASHKHNPKFPRTEEVDLFKKVVCNSQHDRLRNEVIEKSKCGEPKDVFVELKPQASYYQVIPSAVWVKRCVGLCDYDAAGSKCVATRIRDEHVPVRIYNLKTEKESCSTYKVEVHESCGCCAVSAEDCVAPRVHNPRKCSCQCPNMEERRNCLKQRNLNLKWNRYKCTCEPKRRATWRT